MTRLVIHRDYLADRNSHIPHALPVAWALLGDHNRAETTAKAITDLLAQVEVLAKVAVIIHAAGNRERAAQLLTHAEATARVTAPTLRDWALATVATAMAGIGESARAEAIARSISDSGREASTLASVAEAIIATGANGPATELFAEAEVIACSITDPCQRASALISIAEDTVKIRDTDRTVGLLEQAQKAMPATNGTQQAWWTWKSLANAWAGVGEFTRAKAIITSLEDPYVRAWTLLSVAEAMAGTGATSQAAELLSEAQDYRLHCGRP